MSSDELTLTGCCGGEFCAATPMLHVRCGIRVKSKPNVGIVVIEDLMSYISDYAMEAKASAAVAGLENLFFGRFKSSQHIRFEYKFPPLLGLD